jgi:ATP phosphoribosyltransferase
MEKGVMELLADAGIEVVSTARNYRPFVSLPGADAKVLKPQNVVEMLAVGRRDVGFSGADWVAELGAPLVEVLNTGLDPVEVVAAAPRSLLEDGQLPSRRLLVASEYPNLAMSWIVRRGLDAECVTSYGATEVFPPEDADLIVDNRATGATLDANHLVVIDTLMSSSTRLYASPLAWEDPWRRERIEELRLLLASVLEARARVMVEVNASPEVLEAVVRVLPAMRQPTVAPLYGNAGYAVRAAVPKVKLPEIVVALRAAGATDIAVTPISQIVP